MPQGKCAFCGTFVTGGGTAMGKHSVACTSCTPLALKWLAQHEPVAVAASPAASPDDKDDKQEKPAGG